MLQLHEAVALKLTSRLPLFSYASMQMLTWLLCVLVQMSGVWRIVMKPLIDDVPVVAGMVIAMKAPPQVC
jgi:hypothetical protein